MPKDRAGYGRSSQPKLGPAVYIHLMCYTLVGCVLYDRFAAGAQLDPVRSQHNMLMLHVMDSIRRRGGGFF